MHGRVKRIHAIFECFIVEVKGDYFFFRGIDTVNPDVDEFIAQMDKSKIRSIDQKWLVEGAVFHWVIYTQDGEDKSLIKFRKLYWKQEDIDKAKEKGEEMAKKLKWE